MGYPPRIVTASQSSTGAGTGRTIPEYLAALASKAPVPGGGSATALAGALGAALVAMVANLTTGRAKYAAVEGEMQAMRRAAEAARAELTALMEDDERAYAAFAATLALPRGSESERRTRARARQEALRGAATPPLAMARVSRRVLDLARTAAELGNPYLASDAGVAALLAEAALQASAINVRVNLAQINDEAFVAQTETALEQLLQGAAQAKEEIVAIASRRMAGD